jgi:hypothetical protein
MQIAVALDTTAIVTKLAGVKEAKALRSGSIVGDVHGGLTFTDAVAAELETRSTGGWQEIQSSCGQVWTIIVINR